MPRIARITQLVQNIQFLRLRDVDQELWLPGGKDGGRDSQGVWDGHGHTAVFDMENQQGPAGQHRELCSILFLLGASMRNSSCGKGHEEGSLAYAKAGSSLRSPPGNSLASTPKTRVCLLYCFVL